MKLLSAAVLAIIFLFTGASATSDPSAPEFTVSASEVTVNADEEAAWASFDSSDVTMPESPYTLSVQYMRTMDGNHEYTTAPTEFPVWDETDPTKVHIFRVTILHSV